MIIASRTRSSRELSVSISGKSALRICPTFAWLARQEKRQLSSDLAERIARQASGSLRDAEGMLGQLSLLVKKI